MLNEETGVEETQPEPQPEAVRVEEYEISGDKLIGKIKELVQEGSIRRISLKNEEGKTLLEVPLAIGVAGAVAGVLLAPTLAAIGAIAAMVAKLKIVVERVEE